MYKAVNVNENTYKELDKLATQLNKPKAQVVEALVKEHVVAQEEREKAKLKAFNREMDALRKDLKLPQGSKINTDDLDSDFVALADTDYMR